MAKIRFPWLGNKLGTPRMPGAGKAHRQAQVSGSGYGNQTVAKLLGGMANLPKSPKVPGPKSIKVKLKF
jgi:hypothetical protein